MTQESEENITRKKDKTLSKHYTILMDGKKQRILNYKISPSSDDKEVKILRLISKFKFRKYNFDTIISIIIDKDEKLELKGIYNGAALSIGNYSLSIKLKS